MASLFSKPKFPKPVGPSDESIAEARRKNLRASLSRQGRAATILTGGGGLSDAPMGIGASLLGG